MILSVLNVFMWNLCKCNCWLIIKAINTTFFLFKATCFSRGTAVAQWLRCCATNRKVAGSIPAGVSGVFIDIKSFRSVDSASNRNEYKEYFLGVKAADA